MHPYQILGQRPRAGTLGLSSPTPLFCICDCAHSPLLFVSPALCDSTSDSSASPALEQRYHCTCIMTLTGITVTASLFPGCHKSSPVGSFLFTVSIPLRSFIRTCSPPGNTSWMTAVARGELEGGGKAVFLNPRPLLAEIVGP